MSGAGPSAPCPRSTAKHPRQLGKRLLTPLPSCRSRSSSAQAAIAKSPAPVWPPTGALSLPKNFGGNRSAPPGPASRLPLNAPSHRSNAMKTKQLSATTCKLAPCFGCIPIPDNTRPPSPAKALGPRRRFTTEEFTRLVPPACSTASSWQPANRFGSATSPPMQVSTLTPLSTKAGYHLTGTKPRNGAMPVHR